MPYVHGKITDEGIEELRKRIGTGFEGRQPWRTEVNRDCIWHMAHAMSDLNPLYMDPDYAAKSKWGKLVCPHMAISAFDTLRAVGSAGTVSGLPGVHSIWTGSHYEFERPLLEGDQITSRSYLKEVTEGQSKFGGGRSLFQTYEAVYHTAQGEYLGRRSDTWIRIERNATAKTQKYGGGERLAHWTEEDIARFAEEYRNAGRTWHRTFAEANVGDEIPRVIKGPQTPSGEVALEAFFGFYMMGSQVAFRAMERHPKLFIPNEQGSPEPPQRIHWDNAFAQRTLGLPGAYDLGLGRLSWMCQSVTDWMGDEGVLKMIDVQYRGFLYMGDVTWCAGKVKAKSEKDGKGVVELDLWTVNQLDERTTIGTAIVELPM